MTLLQRLMPKSDDFFSDFEAQAATVVEAERFAGEGLDR